MDKPSLNWSDSSIRINKESSSLLLLSIPTLTKLPWPRPVTISIYPALDEVPHVFIQWSTIRSITILRRWWTNWKINQIGFSITTNICFSFLESEKTVRPFLSDPFSGQIIAIIIKFDRLRWLLDQHQTRQWCKRSSSWLINIRPLLYTLVVCPDYSLI